MYTYIYIMIAACMTYAGTLMPKVEKSASGICGPGFIIGSGAGQTASWCQGAPVILGLPQGRLITRDRSHGRVWSIDEVFLW